MLWLILSTTVLVAAPAWSQDQATSFPANIEVVGAVREPSDPLGVTVAGKHAYLCAADDGLHVVDVSDPKKPVKVGTCATLERATDVAVRDQYVYVANGNLGFRVVDVSQPRSPKEAGKCDLPGEAWRVAIAGNFAYVAANGLQVIDISNPTQPKIVGSLEKPEAMPRALAVRDNLVYLGDKGGPLYVIDISDPTKPKDLAWCETGENHGIALQGKYAYLADDDSDVHIVDISKPASPRKIKLWSHWQESPPGFGEAVAVSGNILYVGCSNGAIVAFDVSDPEIPIRVASFNTHSHVYGLRAANGYLFVNTSKGRLVILRTLASPVDIQAAIAEHVRAIGSTDNQLSGNAFAGLIQIGLPAVPALVDELNNSKSGLQLCRAAELLSTIKPAVADRPAAARALIRALGEQGDWHLHAYAVSALLDIEPVDADVKPAATALVKAMRDPAERPGVRATAADSLWRLATQRGNARAVVPLLREALNDGNEETRKLASGALDHLKAE
jgi:hypothetical protein